MMEKFAFMIGSWDLEYQVPQSSFSKADTGSGVGAIKRALNDKYVNFDYECTLSGGEARAHGIFAWDGSINIYRYWWFEDSGSYMQATCDFLKDGLLFMNWENSLLKQTFQQVNPNKIILSMDSPDNEGNYEQVLKVIMTRSK
ncbi:MAG TPA: hypothetical protein PLP19_05975 [bacterium]|nr:hypothetical protein [bacterium]HPN43015.1 hypothetical protein [bacterium]